MEVTLSQEKIIHQSSTDARASEANENAYGNRLLR
jgi:hypothetical protein